MFCRVPGDAVQKQIRRIYPDRSKITHKYITASKTVQMLVLQGLLFSGQARVGTKRNVYTNFKKRTNHRSVETGRVSFGVTFACKPNGERYPPGFDAVTHL
jgi:hypothetical protein